RVDPDTGTWRLRGQFPNSQHILSPGLFVRIRLPIGEPYQAILVPEQALGTDQGQKFVYVVNDQNNAIYRSVKVGRFQEGLRVITQGLATDEKVVFSGLQRVRPDSEVIPKLIATPPGTEPRTVGKSPDSGNKGQESGVRKQDSKVSNPESGQQGSRNGK